MLDEDVEETGTGTQPSQPSWKTQHEEIEALAARKPPAKFELVINRGAMTIDSPTLEVSWRFPDEVIALRPTHILVFLWYMDDGGRNTLHEERHVLLVTDAFGYIPLHWAGKIRIFAWALSDEALQCEYCMTYKCQKEKTAAGFVTRAMKELDEGGFKWKPTENQLRGQQADLLVTDSGPYTYLARYYNSPPRPVNEKKLCWNSNENKLEFHVENHFPLAAVAELELRVPAEIFAPRPKSSLTRALWQWVNLWHDREPADECAYRRRMMLAFTIQPPVEFLRWTAKAVYGAIKALATTTKDAYDPVLRVLDGWYKRLKRPAPPPKVETPEELAAREKLNAERWAREEKEEEARKQELVEQQKLRAQKEKDAYSAWLTQNCGTYAPGNGPRPMGLPRPKPREATIAKRLRLIYAGVKGLVCRTYDRGNKS